MLYVSDSSGGNWAIVNNSAQSQEQSMPTVNTHLQLVATGTSSPMSYWELDL